MFCFALIASAVAAGSAGAKPVTDEPQQLAARRAQVQRISSEIHSLDVQLETTIEAYNSAPGKLSRIARERAVVRRKLTFARRNLAVEERRLGARLRAIYTSGEEDATLAILLGSRSMSDFLDRWATADRIAAQDRQVLTDVSDFNQEVTRRNGQLQRAVNRQKRVLAEAAAARRQIEARLQERRRLVSSIEGEIALLLVQERARQELLRAEAEQRLAGQRAAQLRALQAATRQGAVGASAVSPDGVVTVAPPSPYTGVVAIALQYLGVPYVWGGATPFGFDCSGLTMYVFAQVGVSLPHYAASQFLMGVPVARNELQPGDLVFFHELGHMGIYIGNALFIHAPHTGDVVKISSLSEPWYAATYVGARRIL